MSKLTAWLVTLVGVLLVLSAAGLVNITGMLVQWIVAIAVLVIGIGKLSRNYSGKRR